MADAERLKQAVADYRDNRLKWAQIKERYSVNHTEFYAALALLGVAPHSRRTCACPVCNTRMSQNKTACSQSCREILANDALYGAVARGDLVACKGGCGKFLKPHRDVCGRECKAKVEKAQLELVTRRFERAVDYGVPLEDLADRFGVSAGEADRRRAAYRARKGDLRATS